MRRIRVSNEPKYQKTEKGFGKAEVTWLNTVILRNTALSVSDLLIRHRQLSQVMPGLLVSAGIQYKITFFCLWKRIKDKSLLSY